MIHGALTVNTTSVKVPLGAGDRPVILNTGETTLYIGNTDEVDSANGLPLAPNVGYEFPNTLEFSEWNELWVVSSAEGGEVRYATVG